MPRFARLCALAVALAGAFVGPGVARAQAPSWAVAAPERFGGTMSVVASGPGGATLVAAFHGGDVRGVAAVTATPEGPRFFVTVYGDGGEALVWRAYAPAAGAPVDLSAPGAASTFARDATRGTVALPVPMTSAGGEAPDWATGRAAVIASRYEGTASVVASLAFDGATSAHAGDRLAAFGPDGQGGEELRGVAGPTATGAGRRFLLTVHGRPGEVLTLRAYDAATLTVRTLTAPSLAGAAFAFASDAVAGTVALPLALATTDAPAAPAWSVDPARYEATMSLVGTLGAGGTDTDRLAAFGPAASGTGSEVRGVATRTSRNGPSVFFLTIHGRAGETIRLAHHDGLTGRVSPVPGRYVFAPNAVVGSALAPAALATLDPATAPLDTSAWRLNPAAFAATMSMQATLSGVEGAAGDRVALFDALANGRPGALRGVAHATATPSGPRFFVTLYGAPADAGRPLVAQVFDATGALVRRATAPALAFAPDGVAGTTAAPVALVAGVPDEVFVYPGDAGGDGVVSQNDVLPISLYFGHRGTPRADAGLGFAPRRAVTWDAVGPTRADTNGDGVVNQNDMLAIGFNFGQRSAAPGVAAEGGSAPAVAAGSAAAGAGGSAAGGEAVALRVEGPAEVRAGERLALRVRASGAAALRGAGFRLAYDVAAFDLVGVEAPGALPLTRGDADGLAVGLAFTGVAPRPADGTAVATVWLRAKAGATGAHALGLAEAAVVTATGEQPRPSVEGTTVQIVGAVGLEGEGRSEAFSLALAGPHPFGDETALRVRLPVAAPLVVTLRDVLGRTVAVLAEGDRPAGDALVPLDGRSLAPGVYLVHARAGADAATLRLVHR